MTLQLLWEEYRQANPEGYRYSRFCELYQRWRSKLDVVLRQEHKAGEKMFVDWAGATIPVYDRHTGHPGKRRCSWPRWAPVPTPGPRPRAISRWKSWLRGARARLRTFWHGIPALAVPDNTKTGVTKAHRYDPDLNPTYYNFALALRLRHRARAAVQAERQSQGRKCRASGPALDRGGAAASQVLLARRTERGHPRAARQAESPALPQEGRGRGQSGRKRQGGELPPPPPGAGQTAPLWSYTRRTA